MVSNQEFITSRHCFDNVSWPKDFHELKLMDDAFKCAICYEYLKTSMITLCGHTYCSLCIRKYLTYKKACPTCFEETFENSLRANRILDRLVEIFSKIKKPLIKHLQIAAVHFEQLNNAHSPKNVTIADGRLATPTRVTAKGKLNVSPVVGVPSNAEISKKLNETSGHPSHNSSTVPQSSNAVPDQGECKMHTVPSMFLQPKPESSPKPLAVPTVACPVCNVKIPERNINVHLDNCLQNVDRPPVSQAKRIQKRKPLAKMLWSIMPEKDLRKKLKEYGLNSQGDKKTLMARIQKYITLYNAECDTEEPRPISEIIKLVEREEKIGQQPNVMQQRLTLNKVDPKEVEERNKKYRQENKEAFMKLIKQMEEREGKNIKPASRSTNFIHDDASNAEDHNFNEKYNSGRGLTISLPSTSKVIVDHIDLCDSNGPTSPVLDSNILNLEPQIFLEEGSKSNEYTDEMPQEDLGPPLRSPILRKSPSRSSPILCASPSRSSPNLLASPSRPPSLNYCVRTNYLRSSPSRSSPILRSSPLRSSPNLCSSPPNLRLSPSRSSPILRPSPVWSSAILQSSPSRSSPKLDSSPIRPFSDTPQICSQSPKLESPSCIEPLTELSDSEDSFSLLNMQKIDYEDNLSNVSEEESEAISRLESTGNKVTNSEMNDPSFLIDTEDLRNAEESEEVPLPLRKSKRKLNKSSSSVTVQETRRTRRRIQK